MEVKKQQYEGICKKILLKYFAQGKPLPDKYKLNDEANALYNASYRSQSVDEYVENARKSSKLSAALIDAHMQEALYLATSMAPTQEFYLSDTEEHLEAFKENLKKYAEINND
jgi:hypothetical protein